MLPSRTAPRVAGAAILLVTHGIDEAICLSQRIAVRTSRPCRIKPLVEVATDFRNGAEDIRAAPEFERIRHEVWTLRRDEVLVAEQEERRKKLRRSATRILQEVGLGG